MAASKRLTKFLTTPSKVASALDWKKLNSSILSLDISSARIDMTLAYHPSVGQAVELQPIELQFERISKKKVLSAKVLSELQEVLQVHKVCSFVVGWPLQKEGRMGASCGRVLFTLDALLEGSSHIMTNNRKFCLWDGSHVQLEHDDEFGRCKTFGLSSKCDPDFIHFASKEQYEQRKKPVDTWSDFCRAHWPELVEQQSTYSKEEEEEECSA